MKIVWTSTKILFLIAAVLLAIAPILFFVGDGEKPFRSYFLIVYKILLIAILLLTKLIPIPQIIKIFAFMETYFGPGFFILFAGIVLNFKL